MEKLRHLQNSKTKIILKKMNKNKKIICNLLKKISNNNKCNNKNNDKANSNNNKHKLIMN